jgi:D-alanyl-D-alanine carboxypeptidase
MPYHVFQGGQRRRRRRWPTLLAVVALLASGAAIARILVPAGEPRARRAPAPTAEAPGLADGAPAPLAGGGTAPSPLSLRLDDPRDVLRLRFKRPPRSGLLFDLDTGRVLWRRDPTRVLPIASLTKMMTALIVVQRARPADKVRVTKEALAYKGSGVGVLPRGKRVKLETMLNGLLLPSGNDAAIALAQRVSGTVERFVVRMNEQARALGLACTRFSSPSGFEDERNHSCSTSRAWPGSSGAAGPCCRSPSRAGGSSCSTTTRSCASGIPARSGSRPASRTRPGAASSSPPSATAAAWGSCSCTRPIPPARLACC